MGTIGKRILTVAVGCSWRPEFRMPGRRPFRPSRCPGAARVPVREKCGCGHGKGCDCGVTTGSTKGCIARKAAHARQAEAGGPAMKEEMARHMEEMRGTIAKLRALEGGWRP